MSLSVSAAAARAAVSAAAGLGIACAEPVVLADGANVIVYLSPSPVVAKVAATTAAIRVDGAAWLQRELEVAHFLTRAGAPVLAPSREVPATVHHSHGHVMSFWTYLEPSSAALPDESTAGSMLRDLHAALRSYPDPCQQLRLLNLTVWYALYAERLPKCRQRAAELLATWRTSLS